MKTTVDREHTGRDGLPSLTGLRFFAAAFVVGYHLTRQVGPLTDISYLFWYGRSGVTLFFILSGFVLAWTYADNATTLRVFWWRRFARVWPLHLIATALSVTAYALLHVKVSVVGVLAALGLVHAWSPAPRIFNGGNGATWSLSVEAFFYLCFPALLTMYSRAANHRRVAIGTLVSCLALSGVIWLVVGLVVTDPVRRAWTTDYFPPIRLLQFIVGVAFGLAFARGWRPRVPMRVALAVFVLYDISLIGWLTLVAESSPWSPYSGSQLLAVPVYLLIVIAAASSDLQDRSVPLGHPWLIRLGHWSFAWYLVHEIVLRLIVAWFGRPAGLAGTAAIWIGVIAVSQALAGLLFTFIERPLERRLRSFDRKACFAKKMTRRAEVPNRSMSSSDTGFLR